MIRPKLIRLGGIHSNGEPAPDPLGVDLHDASFEGSTSAYARHLILDHGFTREDLADLPGGSDQSAWTALNDLHWRARRLPADALETFGPDAVFYRAPAVTVHANGEVYYEGPGFDEQEKGFVGDNAGFARHLVEDHGYRPRDVEVFAAEGGTAGWYTLRSMHTAARLEGTL